MVSDCCLQMLTVLTKPTDPFDDLLPPKRETSALVKGIPHVFLLIVRLLVFFWIDSGISQATNRPHFFFSESMAFGQATFNKVNRHIFEWLYALEAGNRVGISQKVTFWRCFSRTPIVEGGCPSQTSTLNPGVSLFCPYGGYTGYWRLRIVWPEPAFEKRGASRWHSGLLWLGCGF